MANGENGVKISKQSYISLGVMLIILSGVVYIVSAMTQISTGVQQNEANIKRVEGVVVPRNELEARLRNIDENIVDIKVLLQQR